MIMIWPYDNDLVGDGSGWEVVETSTKIVFPSSTLIADGKHRSSSAATDAHVKSPT